MDMLSFSLVLALAVPGCVAFSAPPCGLRVIAPGGLGRPQEAVGMGVARGRAATGLVLMAEARWTKDDVARRAGAAWGSDEVVKGSPFGLAKALKKPKNTICVAAEIKRKDLDGEEICKIPNDGFVLEELSMGFHDAKVTRSRRRRSKSR